MNKRFRRHLQRLGLVTLGLLTAGLVWFEPAPQAATEPWIPTVPVQWDKQYERVPDWSQLTFANLPPLLSGGAIEIPGDLVSSLGYDPSRIWQAGQSVAEVLKLGDFQTSLYPQLFNLQTLAQMGQIDLSQVALSALEMVGWQRVEDLVSAIPGLGNLRLEQVPPLEALISEALPVSSLQGLNGNDLTLSNLVAEFPDLGQLSLGQLGSQLNSFALTDIPGLTGISLQNFRDWGNSTIGGVPGLASVPLDQMPNPLSGAGAIGQIDMVYGQAETQRQTTISGSKQAGFQVPCEESCAHVEFAGTPGLHGKQWISGQVQQVPGGEGFLSFVNGGQEPTGRHPFGDAFKVALWDVDESSGTVSTALFFRMCQRGGFLTPDLGCTPYFIGPVPFMTYRETDFMLIGAVDGGSGGQASSSLPVVSASPGALGQTASQGAQPQAADLSSLQPCEPSNGGLDLGSLSTAIATLSRYPTAIGPYGCDTQGHCGRRLGQYPLISYQPEVQAMIASQPGGQEFLKRVESGAEVNADEVERFLPSSTQTHLVKESLQAIAEQAQREGLSDTALVERIGQHYFGGPGVPVEGTVADIQGQVFLNPQTASLSQAYAQAKGCMAQGGGQG
ncbi:hypothetical protein IQ273_12995 [Nodosilinea sp. LEGE 07298]|uniref:hypothetical protein n=1 Tax=Nodosilinea sp. LEGE 07298 TaxID=2777970 RepID=UPI00187E1852|nr:hypothetical protein [Nodosilinea sp. LEGE 07298]MBE9110330.1 hypothetical protein [Nodosilinea sp. LEGE 07298]